MLDIPLSPALSADTCPTPSVVLLDRHGRPAGTAPKSTVHGPNTPLHLAFSCYAIDGAGRILLTRRAAAKRTWPSTWSNACCGHPQPGETLRQAVGRHLLAELHVQPVEMALAVPDFAYRATMDDGTVEHELCPVVVATIGGDLWPDPDEADAAEWVAWDVLVARARHAPATLSPWSVRQIAVLDAALGHPLTWLPTMPPPAPAARMARGERRPAATATDEQPGVTSPAIADSAAASSRCAVRTAVAPFGDALGARLDDVVATRIDRLGALDSRSAVLGEVLGDLLARSAKRLRPAFVHWGHVAAGGDGAASDVLDLAAAVELLHTFALVHDDVIDRSPTRRGGPAAHTRLAGAGADGDRAWFGASAAIVAGDLAFVWADELVDAACAGAEHAAAVRQAYTTLRTEVIVGQYLDLHVSNQPAGEDAAGADPLRVALLKSGRYTVTRPLELGARLAGAGDTVLAPLLAYGDAAGIAFQLRDDVLGVFGDESATGKDAFGDLREGKRTLLVVRARELAATPARRELDGLLGDPQLTDAGAARCREIIAASGALASVEARIGAEAAVAAAALADVAEPARRPLGELLDALTDRAW